MKTPVPLVLIAARGRNGVIGRDNVMPWRIASDLRHFRALTMGKPLILGRKTWQSIGRPLPGRSLLVVSRDAGLPLPADAVLCRDPAEAVTEARRLAGQQGVGEVMVGGGAAIYASLIGVADRLEITEVDLDPPGDAVFPSVDPALWREVSRSTRAPEPGETAGFAFVTYQRC